MSTGPDDQLQAATADTAKYIAGVHTVRDDVDSVVVEAPLPRVAEFLRALVSPDVDRCSHLADVPLQPAFISAWEGYLRCGDCLAVMPELRPPSQRCDGCGRATAGRHAVAALHVEHYIAALRLCRRCDRDFTEEAGP